MKISCSKSALLKGVNIVSKAVSSKTTMTILECILFSAENHVITLTANDMELGIETIVEGTIEEEGKLALDAKIISEIIRKLPDNEIVIESDSAFSTTITCEKSVFTIPGRSGDEFAYLPSVEALNKIVLSQFTLKELIRQTIFSTLDNENNPMMSGELIEVNGNELRMVSLDGHRISVRNVQLNDQYDHAKIVVPGKTLSEISKILTGEADREVSMFFTQNHVVFEFDDTVVVSRLIEGQYYKIDQMLHNDYETKVSVNKRELLSCIDRATLLVKESDKKPIIMSITDGLLKIMLKSSLGTMNEELAIEKSGSDMMIGFNPRFLIDALRVIDDETVQLYMINSKSPCYIRDEEKSYIYMILPVTFIQSDAK